MNKQGFSQTLVIVVLFILILIGGAYYLGTLKNNNTTITSVSSTNLSPTITQTNTPDTCITEKDDILSVLSTFESLQQSKNSSGVLRLFATPQSQQDMSDFQNLSGENPHVSSPRLYNNVSTNYNTLSYKIIQPPTKNSENNCSVSIEEQRSDYGGPANPKYLPTTSEDFTLILTKQNGAWKINQYQSQKSNIRPGEFSGFLMEYITK